MKRMFLPVFVLCLFVSMLFVPSSTCFAADVTLKWDVVPNAVGYKIHQSTTIDPVKMRPTNWTVVKDVPGGTVNTATLTGVPDTGLVFFRAAAYNAEGEGIRYNSGAWFCGDCGPPPVVPAMGIL